MNYDAALIAGGRSRRFGGQDKAFLSWNGEELWVFQLRKLLSLPEADQVFLSTHAGQSFPDAIEGVTRVIDEVADLGPLGGLKTVLSRSHAERVVILGVDMPLVGADFLARLVHSGKCQAPKWGGRWEPLAAVYPRETLLPLIDRAIAEGRLALRDLLDEAERLGMIEAFDIAPGDPEAALFANINTPGDFASLQQGALTHRTLLSRYKQGTGFSPPESDWLAREEPLEVRVNGQSVSIMMRTPGHDDELAVGFLFTESVIRSAAEVLSIDHCPDPDASRRGNTVDVRLAEDANLSSLTRHVFASSSCGVCGKATIDSVFLQFPPLEKPVGSDPEVILGLPGKLRASQETFDKTGGLHASAIFSREGELLLLREDVGRHNALDKAIGHALRHEIDLSTSLLLVSGRISFELMQKALAARIPVVAGISAPSSLAVELARQSRVTLIGFLRGGGFNLYSPASGSFDGVIE